MALIPMKLATPIRFYLSDRISKILVRHFAKGSRIDTFGFSFIDLLNCGADLDQIKDIKGIGPKSFERIAKSFNSLDIHP